MWSVIVLAATGAVLLVPATAPAGVITSTAATGASVMQRTATECTEWRDGTRSGEECRSVYGPVSSECSSEFEQWNLYDRGHRRCSVGTEETRVTCGSRRWHETEAARQHGGGGCAAAVEGISPGCDENYSYRLSNYQQIERRGEAWCHAEPVSQDPVPVPYVDEVRLP